MKRIKKTHRQYGPSSNFDEFGDPIPPKWLASYEIEDSPGRWREISESEALRLLNSGQALMV